MKDTVKVTRADNKLQIDIQEGNQERWLSLSLEQGIELMWKLERELEASNNPELLREPDEKCVSIGKGVSRIRGEQDITQQRLAEITGMARGYLSDLERGERNPTERTIRRLIKHFDIEYDVFMSEYCGLDEKK